MALSNDEKKRIYEEEKNRLEAQEDIKGKLESKKNKKTAYGCLGCVGIVIVFAIIVAGTSTTSDTEKTREEITLTLNASVGFFESQFVIRNKDSFDWTNVKMEVNSKTFASGYILKSARMMAGETYTVGAMQFAKSDGEKFNPFTHKPLNFSIHCDTPTGKGFYYGKME